MFAERAGRRPAEAAIAADQFAESPAALQLCVFAGLGRRDEVDRGYLRPRAGR
jgi:hypothetical protein